MYKLRIAALILLAALCLSTVMSCGGGGDKTPIKDADASVQPDYTIAETEAPDPWGDGLPDSDFGIILQPKFDEKQKDYRVAVANGCSVVLFPIYLKNEDMSGIVTEALCAVGNNSILPVYYEYSLKSKGTRDAESEAMLDFIISHISFDFGWVHSISIATIGAALSTMIGSGNSDFASFYAANAQAYEAGFQTVLDTYKEIG